jgi:TonB family protein
MSFFFDVQATSSLFAGYIEEVQQVLRANHVGFGTPSDFLTFAQTLEDDTQLRSDLAVLVHPLMEGEKKISLRTVLSIIAIAVGGPDLVTSDCDKSQPVNVLVDFLTSVRSSSPANSQNPSYLEHEQHSEQVDASDQSELEAVATRSDQDPQSTAGNHYVESLTRLELNALQVKHYLDSIDQRISRIEPRLDNLPTYVPSPTTPHPVSGSGSEYGHVPDGRYSAMIATENLPHRPQDEASPPDRSHTQTLHTQTRIPSEMSSLLENYSRKKLSRRKLEIPIITGAALVLLLLLYWGFNQNTPSTQVDPVNPSPAQTTTIPSSNPAPANDGNTATPPESATSLPSRSHAPADRALTKRVQNRPSLNSAPPRPSAVSSSSLTPVTTSVASSPSLDESSYTSSLTQPVNVSSGVMAANVLSAPQPSYPKLASLTHMQGEVVMQAIISKDGTIENVHVIKGHRLLRSAATNAVRAWRYRPYRINGQPVAVATTVSVDFKRPE